MGQIVVGYDGSGCGNAAVDAGVEIAKGLGDDVTIVFGYAPPGLWGGEIVEHEEAIEEFGAKVMGEAKRRASAAGIDPTVEMVPKRGPDALIEVADKLDARMIVVGSYGDPPLKGVILGSTPYKLLHEASRPVLVVPAG